MHRSLFPLVAALAACHDDPPQWPVDRLELPGDRFYPESINAAADGTIVVGSLGTGQIVRFAPGDPNPVVVVPPSADRNIAGVLVDGHTVLACTGSIATFGQGNVVTRFSLTDGTALARYPLPDGAFCNDLAFDDSHALYIADSIGGRVFKLAADGSTPIVWASHPALLGPMPGALGADGIAYDGKHGFYVNNVSTGQLVHIAIAGNGEAGEAHEIVVTPPLTGPDGMRALDEHTLLVAEGPANRVSKLVISDATAQRVTISTDVVEPASVVLVGDDAWAIEGQILRMFAMPPVAPSLPFLVRRIPLDDLDD
jgi:hypothetical protein